MTVTISRVLLCSVIGATMLAMTAGARAFYLMPLKKGQPPPDLSYFKQ